MNLTKTVFGPEEWAGTEAQILAQKRLFAARSRMVPGSLVSQGRTLLVLDGVHRGWSDLESLVCDFRRVIIIDSKDRLESYASELEHETVLGQERFLLFSATQQTVLERLTVVERETARDAENFTFEVLNEDAPRSEVEEIQSLHIGSHLAPLPGWFLRSKLDGTLTLVLRDVLGRLCGCATAVDLGHPNVRHPQRRVSMIGAVCLIPEMRGRGLSPLLNLRALQLAVNEFSAEILWETVERDNAASIAMLRKSGLAVDLEKQLLFIENPVCE